MRYTNRRLLYLLYTLYCMTRSVAKLIDARVSWEGKAIRSVRLSVCLSVRLFPLCLLNRLTFELEFCVCVS